MKYSRMKLVAITTFLLPALVLAEDFSHGHWVDLTHEFSDETISHPRGQQFVHTPSVVGMTPGGFYMATYNYSGSEHAGTHLDAPVHFHEGGNSVEQLTLQQLMGDVVVIDVKRQVATDRQYLVTVEDILNWEQRHGRIPDDSIVLFNTGLANVWPDKIKYIGTDKRGNEGAAEVKNPGVHRDAAMFLSTKRQIKLVGMDASSFDNARQPDRRSHRTFFEHGIPGMENVANLDELPPTGAYMIALPMKIKDGSAAPVRIIAFIPDESP